MKILDRYLVRHFLAPLGACVLIFCVLVLLGRFFDRMGVFVRFQASVKDMVTFLLLGLPYWLNMVLPIATMLALLFSLGQLQQKGEFTAMRSAGIPSWRLYAPFVIVGFCLALVSLWAGLTFLPKLNFESRRIYRENIKRRDAVEYRKDNLVAAGRDRRRFTIGWLDVENSLMKEVIVDRFDSDLAWTETLSAKIAYYRDGKWLFENGIWRQKDANAPMGIREEKFSEKWVEIREKPGDFAVEDKVMDDMTGRELLTRAKRLKVRGAPTYRERVSFHLRVALPFANVVVIALAIPFALRTGTQGRTQNFSYAIGLAFLYWGFTSFTQSLGEQGRLAGWICAWLPNCLFGSFAAWKLFRLT